MVNVEVSDVKQGRRKANFRELIFYFPI